jgi:hypothetical protein
MRQPQAGNVSASPRPASAATPDQEKTQIKRAWNIRDQFFCTMAHY